MRAYEIEIYDLHWTSDTYRSLPTKIYKRLFVFNDIDFNIITLGKKSKEMDAMYGRIKEWLEKENEAKVVDFKFNILKAYMIKE